MSPATRSRIFRWRAGLTAVLNLLLFGAALWALDHMLAYYQYGDIVQALSAVPGGALGLGLVISALGYSTLVGYDYLAFRYVGRPLPLRVMLVPSFVAWAVSNTAPASVLTAGGLRYRLYAGLGLTPAEATVVAGFNVVTYAAGLFAVAGPVLLSHPLATAGGLRWLGSSSRMLGLALVLADAGYLLATRFRRRPFTVLGRELRLPSPRLAFEQLGVSALDWLLSSGALYVLLVSLVRVPYLDFLAAFFLAQIATQVVPLPGGIGVFEAVVLLARPGGAPVPGMLAALLLYRVIYYLLPLLAAGALIGVQEVLRTRQRGQGVTALLGRITALAPHALAFVTFLSGALLLLTGAIPTDERRLAWLANLLPLQVIEASHFFASVVGSALLILAWGLERRVRLAYRLTRLCFGIGIVLALLRSLDLRLALLLALALVMLLAVGRQFPRPASLLREPLPAGWRVAIAAALATAVWVGIFAYRPEDYSGQLWWRFALSSDAPRFLRATVGMSVAVLLFALARLLMRGAPPEAAE